MNNLRSSNLLKAICYIVVPILLILIIMNTASIVILVNNPNEIKQEKDYFETESFKDKYMSQLLYFCNLALRDNSTKQGTIDENIETEYYEAELDVINEKSEIQIQEEMLAKLEADEENYSKDNEIFIDYTKINSYVGENYDVLIISGNLAYTNIKKTTKTDTLSELKEYISTKKHYWIYTGEVITNISTMQYDEIAYEAKFTMLQEKGVEIYSCISDEDANEFVIGKALYGLADRTYKTAPVTILISGILLILVTAYLIISIGHKKNSDEIYTDKLDKIPLEILVTLTGMLLTFECVVLVQFTTLLKEFFTTGVSLILLTGIIIYITVAVFSVTIIRRIKAQVFWKNTLCYKIIKYLYTKIKKLKDIILANTKMNEKIIGLSICISIISAFLVAIAIDSGNILFFLVLIAFWVVIVSSIIDYTNKVYKVREKIQSMYKGEVDKPINEEEFNGELKEVAKELNDISGGLSNAIEEGVKSERLKTELITNVSHDIKTPLTSIINYVDLLKKEDIQNGNAREYLQIIDNKSQRLKKLMEDLIEASKASSGNIKLNIEKLNLGELLKQIRGEFEDKFKKRGLEIIENIPKEDIYINADSKYMYRVMENLYTNISKYALENSRVYIDLMTSGKDENKKAYIILKNISQDKLNISADELMQRFVRGDSSRATSGSGLGLSIAQSLVELQGGKFEIYLDGDLFKVVVEF